MILREIGLDNLANRRSKADYDMMFIDADRFWISRHRHGVAFAATR